MFAYTLDEMEITPAAIDEICTTQISNKIFEMVEAVAAKQQKKALDHVLRPACIKRASDADFIPAGQTVQVS